MPTPLTPEEAGREALEGDLVRFRALDEQDVPLLVNWWQDPSTAVFQDYTMAPKQPEAIAQMFRSWSANSRPGDVGFSVVERATGDLVGHAVLYGASLPARAGVLALMIGAEHVDQGYGSDTVRLLTAFGFQEMGLNRIELRVFSFNDRARVVYRKIGYREEGARRDVVFRAGRYHDEVIMGMLAREWECARSDPTR